MDTQNTITDSNDGANSNQNIDIENILEIPRKDRKNELKDILE